MPNVSLCVQENEVHYNPYVEPPFLCKLILNDGSVIELQVQGSSKELASSMTSPYSATCVSAKIGELCAYIGRRAFKNFKSLTSVTIGDSVTSIATEAFDGCSSLTSVTIPNSVTSITSNDFYFCTNLKSVTIGDSVTSIGTNAFYGCSSLTSVTIPNIVTSIGNNAFYSCTSLTSITSLATTPPTLGGDSVFGMTNSCTIYVPSTSVDAYKAATKWYAYSSRIQAIQQ